MGKDEQGGFYGSGFLKINTGNSQWFATEFFLNSPPCQDCHPKLVEGGGRGENPFSSLGTTHRVTGWDEGVLYLSVC